SRPAGGTYKGEFRLGILTAIISPQGSGGFANSTRTRNGNMKRQCRSYIGRIFVSGLLLLAAAGHSSPTTAAEEARAREALARQLEKSYEPPAEFAGKFGSFRPPLKFADGSVAKSADDWVRRHNEILATWQRRLGAWPALLERPEVK